MIALWMLVWIRKEKMSKINGLNVFVQGILKILNSLLNSSRHFLINFKIKSVQRRHIIPLLKLIRSKKSWKQTKKKL